MDSKQVLNDALIKIKTDYEMAIKNGGNEEKNSAIRSSNIINNIHEFIKQEFINNSISPSKIHPAKSKTKPELELSGFLKTKKQDIAVIPSSPKKETITYNSILLGKTDKTGFEMSQKAISVNVRSQLSSVGKNFDTLFERTYAESLNLHLRTSSIILGEIYLVPLVEYDQKFARKHEIEFGKQLPEKYPIAFNALNNRQSMVNSNYKYERVVLLVVDFDNDEPIIMNKGDLIDHGILNKKTAETIDDNLFNPYTLIPDLLKIYEERHGGTNELKD